MGIRLLHAADLHLGSPFKGLAADRALPPLFADCTLNAFTRLIDFALAERVDGVLLAGDLYDQKDRSLRARLHLRTQLQRLDAAAIKTFIVHGNHDPLDADPGGLALPPSVKVFGPAWEEVDAGAYCVQGQSFPTTEVKENLAAGFARRSQKLSVGLLHCNLGAEVAHSDYAPCTIADLEKAGLDYWALGHIHTRATFPLQGRALAAYPGNLQARHLKELGERGALLVTLDPSRETPPITRFVALDCVRWHRVDVPIEQLQTVDALLDAAVAKIQKTAVGADGHVVQVLLTGRGPLHAQLDSVARLADFEATLRTHLGAKVLLQAVHDSSMGEWELDRLIASGGLISEVALRLNTPPTRAGLGQLWVDAGLDGLDAALAEVGLPPLALEGEGLLRQAVSRSVDLLLEADP